MFFDLQPPMNEVDILTFMLGRALAAIWTLAFHFPRNGCYSKESLLCCVSLQLRGYVLLGKVRLLYCGVIMG